MQGCKHIFQKTNISRHELICGNCGLAVPRELLRDPNQAVVLGSSQEALLLALYYDKGRIGSYMKSNGLNVDLQDDRGNVMITVPRSAKTESKTLIEVMHDKIASRLFCPICGTRSDLNDQSCSCLQDIVADLKEWTFEEDDA